MKYDLSVIIPSIRLQNLPSIYLMLESAMGPKSFEVIIVSPYIPSEEYSGLFNKQNIKSLKDLGSPSRCVQIGSMIAEGEHICWLSDDCTYIAPFSLARCIDQFEYLNPNDGICLRYFEGNENNEFPLQYWNAWYHAGNRLSGIKQNSVLAPLGMYKTKWFKEIGGLDCRYEHINLCTHDLALRTQNCGGKIHLSQQTIARFYWSWHDPESKPVQEAFFKVDDPLFKQEWNKENNTTNIDYFNWIKTPNVWRRFQ